MSVAFAAVTVGAVGGLVVSAVANVAQAATATSPAVLPWFVGISNLAVAGLVTYLVRASKTGAIVFRDVAAEIEECKALTARVTTVCENEQDRADLVMSMLSETNQLLGAVSIQLGKIPGRRAVDRGKR